jgi:hypothetical protein
MLRARLEHLRAAAVEQRALSVNAAATARSVLAQVPVYLLYCFLTSACGLL